MLRVCVHSNCLQICKRRHLNNLSLSRNYSKLHFLGIQLLWSSWWGNGIVADVDVHHSIWEQTCSSCCIGSVQCLLYGLLSLLHHSERLFDGSWVLTCIFNDFAQYWVVSIILIERRYPQGLLRLFEFFIFLVLLLLLSYLIPVLRIKNESRWIQKQLHASLD